jgi:hypothetical protein
MWLVSPKIQNVPFTVSVVVFSNEKARRKEDLGGCRAFLKKSRNCGRCLVNVDANDGAATAIDARRGSHVCCAAFQENF